MKQGYALSTFRLCDLTGHVELKTVRLRSHGGSNPSSCANKNGLLLAGRPIFIATVRVTEPEGFAYRLWRYLAYCVGIPSA